MDGRLHRPGGLDHKRVEAGPTRKRNQRNKNKLEATTRSNCYNYCTVVKRINEEGLSRYYRHVAGYWLLAAGYLAMSTGDLTVTDPISIAGRRA